MRRNRPQTKKIWIQVGKVEKWEKLLAFAKMEKVSIKPREAHSFNQKSKTLENAKKYFEMFLMGSQTDLNPETKV